MKDPKIDWHSDSKTTELLEATGCVDFAQETVGQIFDAAAPAPAPEVNHGP